jgi:hypothetical protein
MKEKIILTLVLLFSVYAFGKIQFPEEKQLKADPEGKGELLSIRLLFNNLTTSGNQEFEDAYSMNFGIDTSYTREGKELAFSITGIFCLSSSIEKGNSKIEGGRSFVFDIDSELSYVIMNANKVFFSAGLYFDSFLSGLYINQTNLKTGVVPWLNTLGIAARTRLYPLQELFLTGYISFSFISIFSKEYQGESTGTPAAEYTLSVSNADAPMQFMFEFSCEYRPVPSFAVNGGIRYKTLGYRANDVSTNKVQSKVFTNFIPFFGVTILF